MKSPKTSSANTIRPIRPGRALALTRALIEGIKTALLALIVYVFALPFVIFAGIGLVILFLANA